MKQLIKEFMYRALYTIIACVAIFGFIYLNYAYQIEYVWSMYHMDSECIDFCWLESTIQDTHYDLKVESSSIQNSMAHCISQTHGFFLTLVSVFIEHASSICLTPGHVAMLACYPVIAMILFQWFGFWLGAMVAMGRLKAYTTVHYFVFILLIHNETLPTGIMLYKEFQIEPSDSELFASGYFIGNESMAKVYFFWLIGLAMISKVTLFLNQTLFRTLIRFHTLILKNNL